MVENKDRWYEYYRYPPEVPGRTNADGVLGGAGGGPTDFQTDPIDRETIWPPEVVQNCDTGTRFRRIVPYIKKQFGHVEALRHGWSSSRFGYIGREPRLIMQYHPFKILANTNNIVPPEFKSISPNESCNVDFAFLKDLEPHSKLVRYIPPNLVPNRVYSKASSGVILFV